MVVLEKLGHEIFKFDVDLLRNDEPVVGLGEEEHVIDHAGHPLQVLQIRVQVLLIRVQIAFPGQHDLGVR
ncbi:hypothetical protein D3C84_1291960 [compost metagenome]